MKRLLCFVCCILTFESFSQVNNTYTRTETSYSTSYTDSFPDINKLVLIRYCNENYSYQPASSLINLYYPRPNLQMRFDQHVVAIYNPVMLSYHFYPTNNIPFVETSMGRPPGLFYGPVYRDSFNPYGVSRPSEAIIFGTINYLLNRPRR